MLRVQDLVVLAVMAVAALGALVYLLGADERRDAERRRRKKRNRFIKEVESWLTLPAVTARRFEGRIDPDDRLASVAIHDQGDVTFRVEVFKGPRIRLTPESPRTRIAKLLGLVKEIEVGDPRFDDLLLVEAANTKEAYGRLRGPVVREKIIEAFQSFGVTKVDVTAEELLATVPFETLRRVGDYPKLLDLLAQTACGLDRVRVRVQALAGTQGRPRCAYCHADVSGEEPDLVACATCTTVLHDACWTELGRCPVLGCLGTSPERAPTQT
jgi:hypothetical protein